MATHLPRPTVLTHNHTLTPSSWALQVVELQKQAQGGDERAEMMLQEMF